MGSEYEAHALSRLQSVAERLVPLALRGEISVQPGTPSERITAEAQRVATDLIALTTHGRTGLARLFFGSAAETVLKNARGPVLIVRQR